MRFVWKYKISGNALNEGLSGLLTKKIAQILEPTVIPISLNEPNNEAKGKLTCSSGHQNHHADVLLLNGAQPGDTSGQHSAVFA